MGSENDFDARLRRLWRVNCKPEKPVQSKPTRRRPTDTERLDFWLRSGGGLIFVPRAAIPKDEIQYVHTRTELDKLMKRARLMREEAKRG